MGLSSALQVGRSALLTSQAAIEVAGNNLANVTTEGYHRQSVQISSRGTQEIGRGIFVGQGVQLESITRLVDEALERRVRNATADQAGSQIRYEFLNQLESIHNELSDNDLSSRLTEFFNRWSELANRPEDSSLRGLVVAEGEKLASYLQSLRSNLIDLRTQVDDSIRQAGHRANDLLSQIERLNEEIVSAERGQGGAHNLRDERDKVIEELSTLLPVNAVENNNGVIDIFVNSTPLVLNGQSRGLEVREENKDGELVISVRIEQDGTLLDTSSGQLGALITGREEDVSYAVQQLDEFTNNLIFQVNNIHAQGQGLRGYSELTSTNRVLDTAFALNTEEAALPFDATHGSFKLHVTQKSSGIRETSQINIDLDGIGADTTLPDLAAAIDAVDNVSAAVTPDGRLQITADSGDFEFTFSDDTSGVLATLGLNAFFEGKNAFDVAMNENVVASPQLVATATTHLSNDNTNVLAMVELADEELGVFDGLTLTEYWNRHVEDLAIRQGQFETQEQADRVVLESLQAQRQAFSGVNVDEEMVNLLAFQRAYQGSARFITVVDELYQTLINTI